MPSIMYHPDTRANPSRVRAGIPPSRGVEELRKFAVGVARDKGAKLEWVSELEGWLTFKDGSRATVYLEPFTPSSKPETGQGRRWDEKGGVLLLRDGTLVSIGAADGNAPAE